MWATTSQRCKSRSRFHAAAEPDDVSFEVVHGREPLRDPLLQPRQPLFVLLQTAQLFLEGLEPVALAADASGELLRRLHVRAWVASGSGGSGGATGTAAPGQSHRSADLC